MSANTKIAMKVWGVAVMAPKQAAAAKAHCFGDCGKISMGSVITDELTGGLFVCCEPTCPHMEREFDNYGKTMSFGRPHDVSLRILKREGTVAGGSMAPAGRAVDEVPL